MARLGVIGGSGVYGLDALKDAREIDLETPFGKPSGPVREGTLGRTEVLFLPQFHRRTCRIKRTSMP